MWSIYRKEINLFFSSLIAYLVIGAFLVINGIFIWLLPDSNILETGYATLDQLFTISPFVLLFLVPAVTMRSFAEENLSGTIEILRTKPISNVQIVLAKFLAGVTLSIIAILPTLVYFYTVYQLSNPLGNMDVGATVGSYIGLVLLAAAYVSIGIFSSSLTNNQIVSFILATVICFFFYGIVDWIIDLPSLRPYEGFLSYLGLQPHYVSFSNGVVDSRDVIYMLCFMALFITLTKTRLESTKW